MADDPDSPARATPAAHEEPAESHVDGAEAPDAVALKTRKKRDKVRAAWIAFTGRILAQLIGAVATVGLGLYVLRTYGTETPPGQAGPAGQVAEAAPRPVGPHGRLSLVVLPFQSFASGARADAFADSFTEAVIADLSRLEDVRVVSRTSAMAYKGTTKTLPAIARELAVDLVVEGAVMRESDRVRVTVQVIDAAADTHLWSGTYDRVTRDILTLQAEVTRAVSQELRVVLGPRRDAAIGLRAGLAPEALDRFLRGRQAVRRRSPANLVEATGHFDRVIELAPSFAPAHAALANTWCLRALDTFGAPAARQALDKAEVSAQVALRLDPTDPDGHLALAVVRHRRDWDWAGAEREYTRVFDLNDGHALARQWYSIFLAEQGDHDLARQQAERAIQLDPHAAPVHRTAGLVALYARRFDRAAAAMRRSLELDPGSGVTRVLLASVLVEQRRHAEAARVVMAVRDPELQDQRLSLLACAALRAGNRAEAQRYRSEATSLPGPRSVVAMARFAALLGTPAEVIASAARAVDDRTQLACALKVHPVFDRVRDLPAFQELMRRVGLS